MKIQQKQGPEWHIQQDILKMLRERGWFCKVIHGNTFQTGLPDLYVCKRNYGSRWIEVKNPKAYKFMASQIETFHRLASEGIGVWILIAATEDEYQKLFGRPNWFWYLKIPNMNP